MRIAFLATALLPTLTIISCSAQTPARIAPGFAITKTPYYVRYVDAECPGEARSITPLVLIEPFWSLQAATAGVDGVVRVSFTVNRETKAVENVQVLASSNAAHFNANALRHVTRWRFEPCRRSDDRRYVLDVVYDFNEWNAGLKRKREL